MSGLTLRIDKYLDGDEAPRVPASIVPIDVSGAKQSSTGESRREFVPISHKPADVAHVDLAPGTYYVATTLPSGEMLADSVTVQEGKTGELVLKAKHSPHEWFSWQHLVGNARPEVFKRAPAPARPKKKVVKKAAKKAAKKVAKRVAKKVTTVARKPVPRAYAPIVRFPGDALKFAVREPATTVVAQSSPRVAIGRPIQLLGSAPAMLVNGDAEGTVWRWLAEATSAHAGTLAMLLNQGQPPLDLPAYTHDTERAVYRLSWTPTSRGDVHALQTLLPASPRQFLVVPRRRCVELLSLPIPWRVIRTYPPREAAIEIGVQQMHASDAFCTTSTARDEALGMLLGYLSSGSLTVARHMAETAQELLYHKFDNPYAAAAGGYSMVGTSALATDREWHGWIRRLMDEFPHIPDGAIQWAQLRLKMRRSQSDIDEATHALKLAYRRGLPFYSMGIKWLLEGLEWIAAKDVEAAEMLRNVRRLAWRTNFQQPFTTLRIGGDTHV